MSDKVSGMSVGRRIRAFRVERGRSLNSVAKEAGLDPSQLSRIETDQSKRVTAAAIQKIALALGLHSSHLMGELKYFEKR